MNDPNEFRKHAHRFVDWMADYYQEIEKYPVKSQVEPGEIYRKLPDDPPLQSESMESIFDDFKKLILPGMTHWQSPDFFAYFPANSSFPSILAEMLTATLAAQCMIWETSPAAAELEEKMMDWLKKMTGLPGNFSGVIQDSASTSTLTALLTAREKYSDYSVNHRGFEKLRFRIYCSEETHSSIEKGVKIAGFGKDNLVKTDVDEQFRLNPDALEKAIQRDLDQGLNPLCVIATLGTTGSTAIDPLEEIAKLCRKYDLWLHVDAAFAGTALILKEFRWMIKGIEMADSLVFNPHKWMFTNFDLSAYFVKDKDALIKTFSINPEYLKTATSGRVNDYRDWGIQLGRRFRALKLWFVIRSFGLEGIKEKLRLHIELAKKLEAKILNHPDFEMIVSRTLNLVCFRFRPEKIEDEASLNRLNEQLLKTINDSGKIFLSHTKLNGKYTLRMVIGQTRVTEQHEAEAWDLILDLANSLKISGAV